MISQRKSPPPCVTASLEVHIDSSFEKGGPRWLIPAMLAPPLPRRIKPGVEFSFQVADLLGFSRETNGLNGCLKCAGEDPKMALLKKLPLGLKSPHPHLPRRRSHPRGDLSPGLGSTFHPCTCPPTCRSDFSKLDVAAASGRGLNALHKPSTIHRGTKAK